MLFLNNTTSVVIALLIGVQSSIGHAQEDVVKSVASTGVEELQLIEYPIAILPFRERGKEVQEMGGQVSDLVFAKLVVDPSLFLVAARISTKPWTKQN